MHVLLSYFISTCVSYRPTFLKKNLKHGYITNFFSAIDSRVPSAHPW